GFGLLNDRASAVLNNRPCRRPIPRGPNLYKKPHRSRDSGPQSRLQPRFIYRLTAARATNNYAAKMLNKTSSICLGLGVLAVLVGVGHAISCLTYSHMGIEGIRGTPTVMECASSVTTCIKINFVQYYTTSTSGVKTNASLTVYSGACGSCTGLPSNYVCTTCSSDQCNSAFAAVRAAAPLTLALPLLMTVALRSF
uniref:DUF753 domain-containing protein n=2 Tax=Macrostomum lignano TaxID=282301 RepID=A0A1I8J6J2_9PLAT